MLARPFRSLDVKLVSQESYRVPGLQVTAAPTSNPYSTGVASSSKYVVFAAAQRGSLSAIELKDTGYMNTAQGCVTFAAHGTEVNDIAVCPYADNVFASVGKDNTVKVFQLNGALNNCISPVVTISGLDSPSSVAWHPSARGVLAVGCKSYVLVVNADFDEFGTSSNPSGVVDGREIYKAAVPVAFGGDIYSMTWCPDGSSLAAVGKDGGLYIFDPRSTSELQSLSPALLGTVMKNPSNAVFLTADRVLVLGLGQMRKPTFVLLDVSGPTPVKVTSGDLACISTGQIMCFHDQPANLLYITIRSSTLLHIIDLVPFLQTPSVNNLAPVATANCGAGVKGFFNAPRRAMSTSDMQVGSIFVLSPNSIEPYNVQGVRKDRRFHEDLYPACAKDQHAMVFDDYADGKNVAPIMFTPSPYGNPTPVATASAPVMAQTQQTPPPAIATATASTPSTNSPAPVLATPTATAIPTSSSSPTSTDALKAYDTKVSSALSNQFKRTPFLHLTGTDSALNKETYSYNLPRFAHMQYGRVLTANADYWAFAMQSTASTVFVRPHSVIGRVLTPKTVHAPSALASFALSPHCNQLAMGSEDGCIRIFELPEPSNKDLEQDINTPSWTVSLGSVRINMVVFHPYVQNILLVGLLDPQSQQDVLLTIPLFADTKGNEVFQSAVLPHGRITDIDCSPDRVHVAVGSNDGNVTILALPSGDVKTVFRPPQGVKEIMVRWAAADRLCTLGFSRGTERSVSLYSVEGLFGNATTALLKTQVIANTHAILPYMDISSGVLIVGNAGSPSYNILHISNEAPFIDLLSTFTCRTDAMCCAFVPKRVVNAREAEILRCVHLSRSQEAWSLPFKVARKRIEFFQDDLYPLGCPEISYEGDAGNWYGGASEARRGELVKFTSMKPADMVNLSEAPAEQLTERQQRYLSMKKQQEDERKEKPTNFLGATTTEDVEKYFQRMCSVVDAPVSSRWDAPIAADNKGGDDDDDW